MTDEIFLTTQELADRWGLSPRTLDNWRAQDKGPKYLKIGGDSFKSTVLYKLRDVVEYEDRMTVSTSESK